MSDENKECLMCGAPVRYDDGVPVYSPALMGAKDVAEALGVKVPNLKHVKVEPITRISGGAIPVYDRADVEREIELRAERAAAAE